MGSLSRNNYMKLYQFFEESVDKFPDNTALICGETVLSYQELERHANQLAHHLLEKNIQEGSVVGILLERSAHCYISILAILKTGAAYVPLEVEYPDDRINYILDDLDFDTIITNSGQLQERALKLPASILLDKEQTFISKQPQHRPDLPKLGHSDESLCYVIYTSGSTGRPKGVQIAHGSICHYVSTAGRIYNMQASDRVYQGFSLAFDASLEEVWMAFAHGATLIACTDKDTRSGVGLLEFLQAHDISVFSTVPTLMSSLEGELHDLRLLILGGEACTSNLIQQWARPGLQILNTYGPTEATVIATYSECQPNTEITIGKPLPGYKVCILDESMQPVAQGQMGELCLGGKGLAKGYVGRPELTQEKFIPHPQDENERLYRTGDLGFVDENGDIRFCGRMDDQIKLRGFRIELNEIESVINAHEAVSQAIIALHTFEQPILVAYLLLNKNKAFNQAEFKSYLREKLPDYMVPAAIELVDVFPLLPSGKVNRNALPKPKQVASDSNYVAPKTDLEKTLAEVWEKSLNLGPVSVEADFFYDLGGHSLLAAKVISHLRKLPELESISILDLYQNPSIRQLAGKIQNSSEKFRAQDTKRETPRHSATDKQYRLCGIAQFFGCLMQYAIASWQFLIVVLCYAWIGERDSFFSLQALAMCVTLFLVMPLLSIGITVVAKWLLLGRVKPGEYPLWGWFYFRWWLVQGLLSNVFQSKYLIGSPLMPLYFRLLGAKIGRDCYIATTHLAVPDMISLGDRSALNADVRALGYIVEDGWLKIGPINIGSDCYVGARSVLNINTVLEDGSVLDDMSMLTSGSIIGKNQFFMGSPAKKATVPANHITAQALPEKQASTFDAVNYAFLHYFAFSLGKMLYFASFLPGVFLLDYFYQQTSFWSCLLIGTPLAAALFLLLHYTNLVITKRLVFHKPKTGIYSLYSFYYLRQSMMDKMLDIDEVGVLADSLFFPYFLKKLGAKIGPKVELGEAPGLIPDFIRIEKGGFAASGVGLAWPVVYKGYISYGEISIGENAFIGNVSLVTQGSKIGDDGLLGCMTMPPADNKAARPGSYWLGSPPVFLPNREIIGGFSDELTFNPSKKLYYTRAIIEIFRILLPSTCTLMLMCSLFYAFDALMKNTSLLTTAVVLPLVECGVNLVIVAALIAMKWVLVGTIKPCIRPLWDLFIWKNDIREFSYGYYINPHLTDIIVGTPFVGMLFRAMGAKIGKKVFINTEGFAEFDLISIGDEACINRDTLIQTHLYEDRIFKLDRLQIQEGCNVGVGSMVLYNTVMEPDSTLGSFSLLMKGESLPKGSCWEGSPAQSSALSQTLPVAGTVPELAIETLSAID